MGLYFPTDPETILPEFASSNKLITDPNSGKLNVIEPAPEQKQNGWVPFRKRPERSVLNWLHKHTYKQLKYWKDTFYPAIDTGMDDHETRISAIEALPVVTVPSFTYGLKTNTISITDLTINSGKTDVYKLNVDGTLNYTLFKKFSLAINTAYQIINIAGTDLWKVASGGIVADTISNENNYSVYVGVKSDGVTNFVIVASSVDATAATQILANYPNCYVNKIGYVFYDSTLKKLYLYRSKKDTKNCYFSEEYSSIYQVDAGTIINTPGPSRTFAMPFLNIPLICKLRIPYLSTPFTRCYLQVTKPYNIKFDLTETGDNFLICDVQDELVVNSMGYVGLVSPSFQLEKHVYGFTNVI